MLLGIKVGSLYSVLAEFANDLDKNIRDLGFVKALKKGNKNKKNRSI